MFICPYSKCLASSQSYFNNQLSGYTPEQDPIRCFDGNQYRIKSGDTFYKVAKFFNISPDDLLELNPDIDPDKLYIGQVITIPVMVAPNICPPGSSSYIVQKGDTFYKISQKFDLPMSALMKANPKVNPDALLVGMNICIPKLFNAYTSPVYNVSFMYPLRWIKADSEHYDGIDGFFRISAISSSSSIEEICGREAHHRLKPYGSKPTITKIDFNGQEACYIIPSADQPMEMREQAALVIAYPKPITISGQDYNYFILWADKNHIKVFPHSMKFLSE